MKIKFINMTVALLFFKEKHQGQRQTQTIRERVNTHRGAITGIPNERALRLRPLAVCPKVWLKVLYSPFGKQCGFTDKEPVNRARILTISALEIYPRK